MEAKKQETTNERLDRMTREMAAGKLPPELQQALHKDSRTRGKPVATVFRHVIKAEWFRTFPLKDRLKILFGYNLVVVIGIPTQNNPGVTHPIIVGETTKLKTASDHMQNVVEAMLEEQKPKVEIEHEPKN